MKKLIQSILLLLLASVPATLLAQMGEAYKMNINGVKVIVQPSGNEIIGNNASNWLAGGDGNDYLTGGGGQDAFQFDTLLDAASNLDAILDFNVDDDVIYLYAGVFTELGDVEVLPELLPAEAFVIGAAAQEADDRIIYDSNTGALFYDGDGVGGAAAIQFAVLTPGLGLTNEDFRVGALF